MHMMLSPVATSEKNRRLYGVNKFIAVLKTIALADFATCKQDSAQSTWRVILKAGFS